MKEKEEEKNFSNKKGWSILGFLISILLLTIAIILSMNEEKASREAKIDDLSINSSAIESMEQASSEISKTVNQVKKSNSLNQINENTINNSINNETSKVNEIEDNNIVESENEQVNQNNENIIKNDNETKEEFIMPVEGEISSSYSIDSLQYSNTLQEWITHRGIDIKADKTTVVKASKSGTIKYIKEDPRYGLSITIEHSDGYQTVYCSLLSTEFVKEGDKVDQGQSIGTVGNSAVFESAEGSHLHFEMLKDGEYVNPDIYLK